MSNQLKNKIILITGSSQGLGKEIAYNYAKAGATVILLARDRKKLEETYDKIVKSKLPEPYAISFDLFSASEQQFAELKNTIISTTGEIDGIVHSATYFYALSTIDFQTIDEWLAQYKVNVVAAMALTKVMLPDLKKSNDASVIFINDSHSEKPKAYWGGFGASKSAINYLCKVLADENARFKNIRFNVLIPGVIDSPLRSRTHAGEDSTVRKPISEIIPDFIYWMSNESKNKNGNIVYL